MQELFPVDNLTVHFNTGTAGGSIVGSVNSHPGSPPVMLVDLTAMTGTGGVDEKWKSDNAGWVMPAIKDIPVVDYTLAHEWGHVVDNESKGLFSHKMYSVASSSEGSNGMSKYAMTPEKDAEGRRSLNAEEFFAEAFAQHVMESTGRTEPSGLYAVEQVGQILKEAGK
jgi:hypothetical protein